MSLIVKQEPDQNGKTPQPELDRSELALCIGHCDQMVRCSIEILRPRIIRLFEEGLDKATIINALIARHHVKEEAKTLGEIPHDYLTIDDLTLIENQMGLNELSEENKTAWLEKFQSGRARYLCPTCGYAGNGEFWHYPAGMGDLMSCYQCGHVAYSKYFTRAWTPEEQAQYEAEQAARSDQFAKQRREKVELEARRKAFMDDIRKDAWKALEQIDHYQTVELDGTDEEDYKFEQHPDGFEDLHQDAIDILSDLIILPLKEGSINLRYPWDSIVGFFKKNLQAATDDVCPMTQFDACAKRFRKMFWQVRRNL